MDNFDRLVQFIDRYTDRGTEELPQIFGEGVGVETAGLICLGQFLDRDWEQLRIYGQISRFCHSQLSQVLKVPQRSL
jgi:hypothetical protein